MDGAKVNDGAKDSNIKCLLNCETENSEASGAVLVLAREQCRPIRH